MWVNKELLGAAALRTGSDIFNGLVQAERKEMKKKNLDETDPVVRRMSLPPPPPRYIAEEEEEEEE